MLIKFKKTRILVFISTVLLSQFATTVNSSESIMINKKNISPYSHSTAEYLAMAKDQDGIDKQNSLILAAGHLIYNGQWRQGMAILAQTNELTDAQLNEKKLLLAKVDLMGDRAKTALSKLASIQEVQDLPLYLNIQFHELLAQAYRAEKKYTESISERVQLESLLSDDDSRLVNQRALWLTLTNLSQAELNTMSEEAASHSVFQGWLQLVLISRKYRDNPQSLLAALDQWQTTYNNHPANLILPNPLDTISYKMLAKPMHVALLIPLSGPLKGPGEAIQDGFMAAYKANNGQEMTKVKVYDTNKGAIEDIYQQSITDGAEYVVGPLIKSQVAAIAGINHPVPTLLLNDSDTSIQDNSYLFGLSPANEAIQVAIRARSKGYQRVLVIAPKTDWGFEVTKAFRNQWEADGGRIADALLYDAKDDLNKKMRDFLHISAAQEREKNIKQVLGQHIEAAPNRRQDFDMVFMLAYPSKARQLIPLLKYYYAGDVPVYATSSVYGGSSNALKDKDLDGVIFCDIPWVFSHQMGARNWPEQFNSYNRLYALGMDSYALATQLNQLILFPADGSSDDNGTLYLKPSKQVARVLEWGQFKEGLAHSIG